MIPGDRLTLALMLTSEPTGLGERHVTQIRTCHRCSERAGRGHVDADAGIRVAGWLARRLVWWRLGLAWRMGSRMARRLGARLGTWMGMASQLGMGRTAFRRGARILRRQVCRPASCPWPVGTALDLGE
jgi:hypothetical protein